MADYARCTVLTTVLAILPCASVRAQFKYVTEPQRCFARAGIERKAAFPEPLESEHLDAVLKLAKDGEPESQYCAGIVLASLSLTRALDHLGIDSAEAEEQAVEWYRKAAGQDHAEAIFELAGLHFSGRGVPEDEAEYYRLEAIAAEKGSTNAQISIARNHLSGEGGTEVSTAKALEYLRSAARGGNSEAMYYLGDFLSDGEYGDGGSWATITPDLEEGLPWIRKCAAECSWPYVAYAQYDLGDLYYRAEDYVEALRWYRRAGEADWGEAQYMVGVMYYEGKGVPQSYAEAAKWFRLVAEQGKPEAQLILGLSYQKGQGVPQDHAEATKWWRLSAEQGNANGQFALGLA